QSGRGVSRCGAAAHWPGRRDRNVGRRCDGRVDGRRLDSRLGRRTGSRDPSAVRGDLRTAQAGGIAMTRAVLLLVLAGWPALAQLQLFVVENGVERPAGTTVDIGSTVTGEPVDKRFRIRNGDQTTARLTALTTEGQGFELVNEPILPFVLVA